MSGVPLRSMIQPDIVREDHASMHKKIIIILGTALISPSCSHAIGQEVDTSPRALMENSTSVNIRYFDPFRERPFPTASGSIDANFDIESTLNCDGERCFGALRSLQTLLLQATPTASPCRHPNYARLKFNYPDGNFDTIYVSYTGRCISITNRYFEVSDNFLIVLRNTLVANW